MESAAQVISVHVTEARDARPVAHFMLPGAKNCASGKAASHPFLSCARPPAPVCLRLSVSTTSCNVPVLILAAG